MIPRLVYVISAYKLPENLIRLVKALDSGSELFLIHVDKRSSSVVYDAMTRGLELPNVVFLPRHKSRYRGFGHVLTTLKGLDYVIERDIRFSHVILLTGQDYPIKPLSQIYARLAASPDKSYLEYDPLPYDGWAKGGLDRLTLADFSLGARTLRVPRRLLAGFLPTDLPDGMKPYGGSSYWILSARHAKYVHQFTRAKPQFSQFFRRAAVPDELFFQTILLNSQFADQLIRDDLRYVDWTQPDEIPAILRSVDLPRLLNTGDLFARKFDVTADADVLDELDARILQQD